MSFENPTEKAKWPEAGSIPEKGADVLYTPVAGSVAKRPNAWVVMDIVEENGTTLVEIWHNRVWDEMTKVKVPLEELRRFNPAH